MRRLVIYMILMILGMSLTGCGTGPKISLISQSQRTDVFTEIKEEAPIPIGFSDLIVKAHIKTHLDNYFILESKDSPHGKPDYPFLLNVDGQAVIWKVRGVKETSPKYDEWDRITPEGGKGIKYELNKKIRLRPGRHTVSFALPAEDYMKEMATTLEEGKSHVLEFKPTYDVEVTTSKKQPRIPLRNFMYGFREYEAFWDGSPVR